MRGEDNIKKIGKMFRGSPITNVLQPGKYQISSTCVRQRTTNKQDIAGLINRKVKEIITCYALYKK